MFDKAEALLPEPYLNHRLGMFRVKLPDTDAFNGALVQTPAGNLLVYRTHPTCSCVFLDEHYQVVPGTHQRLDLWRNDDPRVFYAGGKLYLSTSFHGNGFKRERVELRRILREGYDIGFRVMGKFDTIAEDPGYVRVREKNWAPFEVDGRIFYVHKVNPHRILEADTSSGTVKLVYEKPWNLPYFWQPEWGTNLRLNTPPLRISSEEFLSTFHTFHRRRYFTWFYTFSALPPFEVKRVSSHPVILPSDAVGLNPHNGRHRCIFVTGLYIDKLKNMICLTGGNNDRAVVVIPFSKSDVFGSLVPVPDGRQNFGRSQV